MFRILIVALMLSISGCAVFDGGLVPKTTLGAYEGAADAKPTLSYSTLAYGGFSEGQEMPEVAQITIEEEFVAVLEESNYFKNISKEGDSKDINIDIVLTNTGSPAAMIPAIITGLTLYAIPSWATDNFEVVAKVKRSDGLEKEYTLDDSTTLVQWLPMIFVFPFKNFSVIADVRKNMYKKVLSDMKEDGFFTYN